MKTRRIKKLFKKLALPLTISAGLSFNACSDDNGTPVKVIIRENLPPETELSVEVSQNNSVKASYKGSDQDGYVVDYEVSLTGPSKEIDWVSSRTQYNLLDNLPPGDYILKARAVDNEGTTDVSPAVVSFTIPQNNEQLPPETNPPTLEEIIKTPIDIIQTPTSTTRIFEGATNQQGQISFIDTRSKDGKATVNITDVKTQQPIPNLQVIYEDDPEFKAFFISDPNMEYMPSKAFFSHNSPHDIKTIRREDCNGVYLIQTIDHPEIGILYYKWNSKHNSAWTQHTYKGTIDLETKIRMEDALYTFTDLLYKGLIYFFGVESEISPSDLVELIENEEKNPPKRWDYYTYSGKHLGDRGANFTLIPSNIPTVNIDELKVDGNNLSLFWHASDKTTYDDIPEYFPDNTDITISLGPTQETPDLRYVLKVNDKNGTNNFSELSTRLAPLNNQRIKYENKDIPRGDYSAFIVVTDEVGNTSSKDSVNFSIDTQIEEDTDNLDGSILYTFVDGENNIEIYRMNTDGTNQIRLTKNDYWEESPRSSPDGTKIVFSANRDIFLMDRNGNDIRNITNNPGNDNNHSPSWSPDGNYIAFTSDREDTETEIYIMNSDGTNPQRITHNEGWIRNPSWSPDGRKIIYSNNSVVLSKGKSGSAICIKDLESGITTKLVESVDAFLRDPQWSPKGDKIVFSLAYDAKENDDFDLYMINQDGSDLRNITNNHSTHDLCPSWSPDGNHIVYSLPYTYSRDTEICIIDPDGSNKKSLINNFSNKLEEDYRDPFWSR